MPSVGNAASKPTMGASKPTVGASKPLKGLFDKASSPLVQHADVDALQSLANKYSFPAAPPSPLSPPKTKLPMSKDPRVPVRQRTPPRRYSGPTATFTLQVPDSAPTFRPPPRAVSPPPPHRAPSGGGVLCSHRDPRLILGLG